MRMTSVEECGAGAVCCGRFQRATHGFPSGVVTFPAQEQRARAERPFSPQMPTFWPSHLKAPASSSTQTWRPRSRQWRSHVLFNTHGARVTSGSGRRCSGVP